MRTKVAFAVALVVLGFVVKPVVAHHSFVTGPESLKGLLASNSAENE